MRSVSEWIWYRKIMTPNDVCILRLCQRIYSCVVLNAFCERDQMSISIHSSLPHSNFTFLWTDPNLTLVNMIHIWDSNIWTAVFKFGWQLGTCMTYIYFTVSDHQIQCLESWHEGGRLLLLARNLSHNANKIPNCYVSLNVFSPIGSF